MATDSNWNAQPVRSGQSSTPPVLESPIVRFWILMMSCFCLLGAFVFAGVMVHTFRKMRESERWPTVKGTVTDVRIEEEGFNRFRTEVSYDYVVAGELFMGDRIKHAKVVHNDRESALKYLDGLAKGQTVDVHYDPATPRESVLRTGISTNELGWVIVSPLMIGIGIAGLVTLRRTKEGPTKRVPLPSPFE